MNRNDYSDTGLWRLVILISATGLRAWLRHIEDPTAETRTLAEVKFDASTEGLKERIEEAVYNHPSLLDDYQADIIIETNKTLLVPSEAADDEALSSKCFSQFYEAEGEDIQTMDLGNASMLYTLCPGLKAFLGRTFPGARISCALGILLCHFNRNNPTGERIFAHLQEDTLSLIVLRGEQILMASEFNWHEPDDVIYHIMNAMNVFSLKGDSAELNLSGRKDVRAVIVPKLRKYVAYVASTILPSLPQSADIPLAASICMLRKPTLSKR